MYLVSVSHQCIASVYRVRANIRDHTSVILYSTFVLYSTSVIFFTPHPSDFDGLETAPSAPSGINVARGVARDVARGVARGVVCNVVRGVSRNVARDVSRDVGRIRQYEHLTGAGSPPLFYISHNLSVEMGDFMDKLFILNHLSVRTSLFTD